MKVGLVFEGGASRTYFTNGVIDDLIKENIKADYVIGTSAGIGNGISYVSHQYGRNLKIGLDYMNDKRYMGKRYLIKKGNRSYYNIDFVFDKIPNVYCPLDCKAFDAFGKDVYACATNIRTGKAEYLPVTSADKTWKALVASCSLPLLFQPVVLNGEAYMDGGVAVPVPFSKAIRDGCDKVIVVLTRERDYRKKGLGAFTQLAALKYREYPEFSRKLKHRNYIYNEERRLMFRLEKEGRLFVIAPDCMKNVRRTESDPGELFELYKQGVKCDERAMPALREYLKTEQ